MPATLQLFQWFVQFADGYIFAQFSPEGIERHFKDFAPETSWKETPQGLVFDLAQNHWSEIEKIHGRPIKAGWLPFNQNQKELYEKDPTIRIEILKNPQPLVISISEGWYPYLKKEVSIEYGLFSNETIECKAADLYLGQIRKSDHQVGEINHFNLNISNKEKEEIPA